MFWGCIKDFHPKISVRPLKGFKERRSVCVRYAPICFGKCLSQSLHRVGDERLGESEELGYRRPCCGYCLSALGAFQSSLLWVPCRIEQFYCLGVRYGYVICFGQ